MTTPATLQAAAAATVVSPAQVVAAARAWVGTPFHHQARLKGVGADCAGLIIGVARELGLVAPGFDVTGYPRVPDGTSLLATARAHLLPLVDAAHMQPGDVLVVAFDRDPQHFCIVGDYLHGGLSIIHAASRHGAVVEHRLMFSPAMQFVQAFRIPGVA